MKKEQRKGFRFRSSNLTLLDLLIGVILSAAAAFVCCGYLFSVYMPELKLEYIAFLCVSAVVVLAVSYAISSKIYPGVLGIAVVGGFMLLYEDVRNGILNIPDFIFKKIGVIASEIYEYAPDYTAELSYADKPTVLILAALFVLFLAVVFTVCFFKGSGHGFAFSLVMACASLAFLGHEKANVLFLLCSVALCFLIFSSSGVFGLRHMQHKRVLAAALAFFITAGVLNAFAENISDISDRVSKGIGLDELKASLLGESIPLPDEMYAISPDIRQNSYADVTMGDVGFNNRLLFESYSDYDGAMYLYNASYYEYHDSTWSNFEKKMIFASYPGMNDLITSSESGLLVQKYMKASVPDYVWSSDKIEGMYHGEPCFRAVISRTHPINSEKYIDIIDERFDLINSLPDGASLTDMFGFVTSDSVFSNPDVKQDYIGDVDFASLAKSLLSGYAPEEVGFKEAFYALRDYFATKSYTTNPTKSPGYDKYDSSKSPLYNFLFNTNEGYCVHFATAAALLLREMGYTTRYSVGYVFESANNEFVPIYDRNAHAWVEIFVEGMGWLPLEMTVGFGNFSSEETSAEESSDSDVFEDSSDESSSEEESDVSEESSREFSYDESDTIIVGISDDESDDELVEKFEFPTVPLICALTVLIIIIVVALLLRRARANSYSKRKKFTELPDDDAALLSLIKEEWRFVLDVLALMGLQPLAGEDITAFALRIDETSQGIPSLTQISDIFLAAEFGSKAERSDALSCGAYAVSLNDHAVRHVKLLKRLRAYLSGKLLVRLK